MNLPRTRAAYLLRFAHNLRVDGRFDEDDVRRALANWVYYLNGLAAGSISSVGYEADERGCNISKTMREFGFEPRDGRFHTRDLLELAA